MSSVWHAHEKMNLLKGLKEFGPTDIEQIQQKYVANRTVNEIRFTIEKYQKLGYCKWKKIDDFQGEDAPINKWIKLLKRTKVNSQGVHDILPRALKYIALFEKRSTHSKHVNLEQIYLTLAAYCNGEACKDLDEHSSAFLFENLRKLALKLKKGGPSLDEKLSFAKNVSDFEDVVKAQMVKSYGSRKSKENLVLNPLKVPPNLLTSEGDN